MLGIFDIRKAFDTVPHRKLIKKLDVSPFVLRWIRSYLTVRHHKIVLGGDESNKIPVYIRCAPRISPGPAALPYLY